MQYAVGGTGVGLPSLLNHRLFPVEINMAEEQSRDLYYLHELCFNGSAISQLFNWPKIVYGYYSTQYCTFYSWKVGFMNHENISLLTILRRLILLRDTGSFT